MAFSDGYLAKNLTADVPVKKGTEIMEAMLLSQYIDSPNMKEYYLAYIEELDLLFEAISAVYLGRTLEYATGAQLDVIGRILGQERSIETPAVFFGFATVPAVDGMADKATPTQGGRFLSEENENFILKPLDDMSYQRVLRVKAMLHSREIIDLDRVYTILAILNGRIPETFLLEELANRVLQLTIGTGEVTAENIEIFNYMSRYFLPLGGKFTIVTI